MGPGTRNGRHSRCTSACSSSSSIVGTTSRASKTSARPNSSGAPIRHGNGKRAARGANDVSHGGIDSFGDRQGRRAADCGRRLTGNPCVTQVVPNAPELRLGVRVEEQLDGMDHQPTRLAIQSRIERGGRQPREVGHRQRSRPRGQCGAHRRQPLQGGAVGHLGGARLRRPGTDDQSRTRNILGSKGFHRQRGVVQRAECGCHHDDHRRAQVDRQVAQRHRVGAQLDQEPTGTLDQGQPAGPVGAADAPRAVRRRVGSAIPAAEAAATGASGCG